MATLFNAHLLCLIVGVSGTMQGAVTRDDIFSKKENTLHSSPYSDTEMTCGLRACTQLACASACMATDSCQIFSHNPANGTCVLSRRPDDDPEDYDSGNPAWNSFYRECPKSKGFVLYDTVQPALCLRFVNQTLYQADAKEVCQQYQASLVRIKNDDTYSIVRTILTGVGHSHWVWAGAEDREIEGVHYWNDGTRLYLGTSMWETPDEGYLDEEDCVCVSATWKLVDCPCTYQIPFICQYNI